MAGIFISYRRDDAGGWAGRVRDRLHADFPGVPIFMDVDAIGPGARWRDEITKALAAADVFLAVLDRDFARADSRGRRRLEEPNDPVRHELAAALTREDVTVIPVLVGGATMPAAEELPADVAEITEHNALTLTTADWEPRIARLVDEVRTKLRTPPPPPPRPLPDRDDDTDVREKAESTALLVGLTGAALVVLATALRWDVLVDPFRGGAGDVPFLGTVVAPASIIVAVGALYALLKAWRTGAGALATGLVLGFGVGGVAKYAAMLGQQDPDHLGSDGKLLLGLAGSAVLAAVAMFWLVTRPGENGHPLRLPMRFLAAAGAVLIAAAVFVPFNNSFSGGRWQLQRLTRSEWEAFEPLAVAAVILLAVVFAGTTNRLVLAGLFVALGLVGAFFWLRYIGVPVLQWLQRDDLASVREGGFIGLAGSALVLVAGVVGRGRAVT